MDGGTASVAATTTAARTQTLLRALAWLLLAGWAVTLGLTVWTAPRESTPEQLRADIAAGRVDHYVVVYGTSRGEAAWRVPTVDFNTAAAGPGIAWSLHDGRRRWASITGIPVVEGSSPPRSETPLNPDGTASGPTLPDPLVAPLLAALRHAGATQPLPTPELVEPLAVGVAVVGLVMLLAGPAPQRGNKWFWFWVLNLSAGLGLVAWLVLEHLLPPRSPVTKRHRGLAGFVTSTVAGTALNVGVSFLA
ncbi:MAG TPA: hypothetical protein VFK66_06000 [Oryzihumus sp.]|nr:hypothetical protein [Oryzihumus sp.]